MKITRTTVRATLVGAMTAAMLGVPVASGVAAPCTSLDDTSTLKAAKMISANTKIWIKVKGVRCGRTDTLQGLSAGYTDPENGLVFCSRIRSITMNPTSIMGFNAPAKKVRCSDTGASVSWSTGSPTATAGSGDRATYATFVVDTRAAPDNHHRTNDASLNRTVPA